MKKDEEKRVENLFGSGLPLTCGTVKDNDQTQSNEDATNFLDSSATYSTLDMSEERWGKEGRGEEGKRKENIP